MAVKGNRVEVPSCPAAVSPIVTAQTKPLRHVLGKARKWGMSQKTCREAERKLTARVDTGAEDEEK